MTHAENLHRIAAKLIPLTKRYVLLPEVLEQILNDIRELTEAADELERLERIEEEAMFPTDTSAL